MRLLRRILCLGAHRWRQTLKPKRYPSWMQREWVCLDCGARTVRHMQQPPVIYLAPGEPDPRKPSPYDEEVWL